MFSIVYLLCKSFCISLEKKESQKVKKMSSPELQKARRERGQRQGEKEGRRARFAVKMKILYYIIY
jgi:hypothetical protein